MEEERLIPPQERKSQSRPKSSPSSRDTSLIVVRRPATASSVSGASNLHPIRGQNGGTSLMARDEKQTIKEKGYESERKSETLVHDGVSTSKIDEGWTEGNTEGGDAITGMTEFSSSFTCGRQNVNKQTPYESPPKYCKRQFHEPLL